MILLNSWIKSSKITHSPGKANVVVDALNRKSSCSKDMLNSLRGRLLQEFKGANVALADWAYRYLAFSYEFGVVKAHVFWALIPHRVRITLLVIRDVPLFGFIWTGSWSDSSGSRPNPLHFFLQLSFFPPFFSFPSSLSLNFLFPLILTLPNPYLLFISFLTPLFQSGFAGHSAGSTAHFVAVRVSLPDLLFVSLSFACLQICRRRSPDLPPSPFVVRFVIVLLPSSLNLFICFGFETDLRVLNEYQQIQSFSASTGLFGIYASTGSDFVAQAVDIAASELISIATPRRVSEVQLNVLVVMVVEIFMEEVEMDEGIQTTETNAIGHLIGDTATSRQEPSKVQDKFLVLLW
ncbi:uncharacterized protein LOC120084632 [Benincasa hispida]|uniref:uncharacterized protein LOC120084632 n=1 Tax=Benincasa hispida TaxID=102211 RepID=UPI001902AF4B|nr:uncharacterized protein LOC120084632 [Benincasa hispida]